MCDSFFFSICFILFCSSSAAAAAAAPLIVLSFLVGFLFTRLSKNVCTAFDKDVCTAFADFSLFSEFVLTDTRHGER